MSHPLRVASGAAAFFVGSGLAALALGAFSPRVDAAGETGAAARRVEPAEREIPVRTAAAPRVGYADVIGPALDAVVNIESTRKARPGQMAERGQLPFPFPFQLPDQDGPRDEMPDSASLGSGVIVRADGVILTNNHVVEGADEVKVILRDKREMRAKVLGTDPATDIAVLKVEQEHLPTLPLGRSGDLRVGDLVFAIGSPFNLSQTATMGIVSATGRNNLNITHARNGKEAGYENFIQTDASINPGNSGGALLDSNGDVVGINTAIYSRGSGGNQGVGFAVPIDIARPVMDQILAHGRVTRSRLGVGIQPIDAALAKSYGLPRPEGALVNKVEEGSPAQKAGIRPEDVIVEIDGRPVEDDGQLRLDISSRKPGSTIELGLLRDEDGRQQHRTVTATLVEKQDADQGAAGDTGLTDEDNALRGIEVGELDDLSARERQQLGLSTELQGVVITQIQHGSPAQREGLREGDVIAQIGHQPVKDAAAFKRLAKSEGKGVVRMRIQRGASSLILALEP